MNVIFSLNMPLNQKLLIYERVFGKGEDLLTITAGLHGDEHDGLYIAYTLIAWLSELPEESFGGRVRLIPAANPMGLDVSSRFWPVAQMDINRSFPGNPSGRPTDRMADAIFKVVRNTRYCVDIHSSNVFLQEIPQIRLNQEHFAKSSPLARHFGLEVVWVSPSPTVIEATLAYNLGAAGIPTFVIETGIALRIGLDDCRRILSGIISFMRTVGVLREGVEREFDPPRLADMTNVEFVNAETSGVFIPSVAIGAELLAGSVIGSVIDPITGKAKEQVRARRSGFLFTLRAHPIVYPGSLIARLITPGENGLVRRLGLESNREIAG